MTTLLLEAYEAQLREWPTRGRHVLAQFDDDTIVVYQAYRPAIGHYVAQHQKFGGEFSFSRMTWIKPNFLWMMFRSGWGTKENQEVTLAIRIRRSGFEAILGAAVASSFGASGRPSEAEWQREVAQSDVRLQWDPDHGPAGNPVERRAVQLGIRGPTLRRFADEWLVSVEDISELVAEQRGRKSSDLVTPRERVYPLAGPLAQHIRAGID